MLLHTTACNVTLYLLTEKIVVWNTKTVLKIQFNSISFQMYFTLWRTPTLFSIMTFYVYPANICCGTLKVITLMGKQTNIRRLEVHSYLILLFLCQIKVCRAWFRMIITGVSEVNVWHLYRFFVCADCKLTIYFLVFYSIL